MLNQVQIIGHLGRDPEVRYLQNGDAVCNLAIATTEKWKDKNTDEPQEATEWHRVSVFGKLADICGQYLHKGSLVYISGKLKTRKYTDKDGVEKYQAPRQQQPQRQTAPQQRAPQPQRQAPAPQRQAPQQSAYQAPASGFDADDSNIPF